MHSLSLLLFLRCILVVFICGLPVLHTYFLLGFRLDYVEIDLPHQLTPIVYRCCIPVLFFVSIFVTRFLNGVNNNDP